MGFGIDYIHPKRRLGLIVLLCILYSLMATTVSSLLLMGKYGSRHYDHMNIHFPKEAPSYIRGMLYTAEPLDACSALTNEAVSYSDSFILIVSGGCSISEKVRRAQEAGYHAAILYDDVEHDYLIAERHNPGIYNPTVFVSKASGEEMKKYVEMGDVYVVITPNEGESKMPRMVNYMIILLVGVAALVIYVYERNVPRERFQQFDRIMSNPVLTAMPSLIFRSVVDDKSTSSGCAICLEDYNVGDKLRNLPCKHKFHTICIDAWLTPWRSFCPVCKWDAKTSTSKPPASESTPLISPSPTTSVLSSSDDHIV